jgi:hypothetical protein
VCVALGDEEERFGQVAIEVGEVADVVIALHEARPSTSWTPKLREGSRRLESRNYVHGHASARLQRYCAHGVAC